MIEGRRDESAEEVEVEGHGRGTRGAAWLSIRAPTLAAR